jgi:hypothetical protein
MAPARDGPRIGRGWFVGDVGDVVVIHARFEVNDADFAFYLDYLADVIDRADASRRRAVFYDLATGNSTTAQRRKRLAAVLGPRHDKIHRVVAGCAVASPSPLVRGIATALTWLVSPPCEVRFVPSAGEAFRWIAQLLPGLDAAVEARRYDALKKACCESPDFR